MCESPDPYAIPVEVEYRDGRIEVVLLGDKYDTVERILREAIGPNVVRATAL